MLNCCRLSFALAAPERLDPRSALDKALEWAVEHNALFSVEQAILLSIPYSGFPAAVETLGWLRQKHPQAQPPPEPVPDSATESIFQQVYGDGEPKVRASLRHRHPDLEAWIIDFAYGTVMSSSSLPTATIEALAVSSLIAQGRMTPLHSHLRGALRSGLAPQSIVTLLDSLQDVALPRVLQEARQLLQKESSRP
ncbi:MAG: carboxymuconolactone decarboxylase family protein [Planctomycetota bacterium]|nr:carboxymuconolactone decarboxylase family protein [Planctomycetota bacterium]